jgi:hypothetical protein
VKNEQTYYPRVAKFLTEIDSHRAKFDNLEQWEKSSRGSLYKGFPHVFREVLDSKIESKLGLNSESLFKAN